MFFLQFGLQENHSIDHALVSLTEAVRNTLKKIRVLRGVFQKTLGFFRLIGSLRNPQKVLRIGFFGWDFLNNQGFSECRKTFQGFFLVN